MPQEYGPESHSSALPRNSDYAMNTIRIAKIGFGAYNRLDDISAPFADAAALPSTDRHDAVVLDQPPAEAEASLRQLRSHELYSHSLIYVTQHPSDIGRALSDGLVPHEREQMSQDVRIWRQRHREIEHALADASLESRLLSWLWMGPHRLLHAVRTPSQKDLYSYPLVESLKTSAIEQDTFWVLQFAAQQNWISTRQLVDRVRLCMHCNSGHLNYVDVCPDCQSLSIERQPSLHCFVCGHVGPQEKFMKDRGLFCPNCLSQLRHIGSDYDRPMENYRCRDCQTFFVDALVQVRCLDCGEIHLPEELKVREVHDFQLTEFGRLRCRQGLLKADFNIEAHFDFQGLLKREPFMLLLGWMLDIKRRYKDSVFSIVGMRIVDLRPTLEQLGERRGYALLDSIVARLAELIRDTDRCTRTTDDIIWLFLPETDANGAQRVVARLGELSELLTLVDGTIQIRTTWYSAVDEVSSEESPELLIARLTSQLF